MTQLSEEELRKQIRKELEAEAAQARERRRQRAAPQRDEAEDLRRRILAEERRRFFQDSAEHFEYVNENGDIEWLTREEIAAREGYFDYEEHVEDPQAGRKRFLLLVSLGVLCCALAGWGLIGWMLPAEGRLSVFANVPNASILLDGQESGHRTDAILNLPVGEHLVEVRAPGYQVSGEAVRMVSIQEDQTTICEFILEASALSREP